MPANQRPAAQPPQFPFGDRPGGPPRRADQPRGMYPNPFGVEPPAPSPGPAPPIPRQQFPLPPLPPQPDVSPPLQFPFVDGPVPPRPRPPLPGPGPVVPRQNPPPIAPPSPETSIEDLRDQAERRRRSMEDQNWQSLEPLMEQMSNQRQPLPFELPYAPRPYR